MQTRKRTIQSVIPSNSTIGGSSPWEGRSSPAWLAAKVPFSIDLDEETLVEDGGTMSSEGGAFKGEAEPF